jgi:D-beta-D-heptose 7-phosphate kinase/D-beta-D-heptose 1-phosphate adenosyltransferase
MDNLTDLTARLAGRHVCVLGDVMLDHFLIGRVDRISPEAPVPVVRFARDEYRLGGAGNVAQNIVTLGSRASIVGLVGQDEAAAELRRCLDRSAVSTDRLVVDPSRPTTRKVRIVTSRNQQVARVDYEVDEDVSGDALNAISARVADAATHVDAIVLSDYRKGVVSADVIAATVAAAGTRRVPVLVDPKVADPDRYRGTWLITPNHHEAELMTQRVIRTPDDARAAARTLHNRTGSNVIVTLGEHGMWIFDATGARPAEQALPAVAREVADVTGAGDTVIAVLALALAAGAPLIDAARLANIAAGLVVARFGPASVTADEIAAALADQSQT